MKQNSVLNVILKKTFLVNGLEMIDKTIEMSPKIKKRERQRECLKSKSEKRRAYDGNKGISDPNFKMTDKT